MEKLHKISVCDALQEKYCSVKDDLEGFDNINVVVVRNFALVKSFDRMKIIGLDHCNIENAGQDGEIQKMCPVVEELDLSSNIFSDWNEVLNISEQLDHLEVFNLSHNPFDKFSLSGTHLAYKDSMLSKLVLNNTQIDVETLIKLLQFFPSVNELHISVNSISIIPDGITAVFTSVQTLHFAKNDVTDWREIEKLGVIFPSLLSLNVCENPIVAIPAENSGERCFSCLQKLNVMDTKISEFDSVDSLRQFPSLSELRIKRCPFYSHFATEKENRRMVIALLPALKHLNGSLVDVEEREDAERMFIRYSDQQKISNSARYEQLIKHYGEVGHLADIDYNLYDIEIKGDVQENFLVKLDITKTTGKLYKEIARRLELSPKQFTLVLYRMGELDYRFPGRPLFFNKKKLSTFNINEGDYIILRQMNIIE